MPKPETIQMINNVLNVRLRNLTIDEINLEVINNLKHELQGFDEVFNGILPALYETLKESNNTEVFVEGTTNIFNYPEYNNIEKAKEILSFLRASRFFLVRARQMSYNKPAHYPAKGIDLR